MDTEPNQPPKIDVPNQKITPEVTFSVEGKPTTLSINQINGLFGDIRNFNDQFSMGAIMAKLFTSKLGTADEKTPPEGLNQVGQEAQMLTASGINLIHESTLDKLGLDLEPVSGKNARLVTGD